MAGLLTRDELVAEVNALTELLRLMPPSPESRVCVVCKTLYTLPRRSRCFCDVESDRI